MEDALCTYDLFLFLIAVNSASQAMQQVLDQVSAAGQTGKGETKKEPSK